MSLWLSRIRLYPIKSMDGVDVAEAELLAPGNLRHDRRFALQDADQKLVTGKRLPAIHRIRCRFDASLTSVAIGREGDEQRWDFSLPKDRAALEQWLSEALQQPLRLVENDETGFPDDTEFVGPTLVSRGSLREAASWFPGLEEQQMSARMRVNLEIDGCSPFWEDRLVAEQPVPFRVGESELWGVNACARCVVPSRSPQTGHTWEMFRERFRAMRREHLPAWAAPQRFDHFYRFTVNTRGRRPGRIRCGDPVELL